MTAGQYHLNPVTGDAGACRAEKGQCPFGGANEHFATADEAMANYEMLMAGMTLPEPTAREVKFTNSIDNLVQDVIVDEGVTLSLVDPDEPLGMPLVEAPMKELGDRIVAGEYDAYYDDPKTDERRQARVTIDEQGRVLAIRVPDPSADAARILSQESLVAAAEAAEELNHGVLHDQEVDEAELGSFHRRMVAAENEVKLAEDHLIAVQEAHELSLQDAQGQKAMADAESKLIAARDNLNSLENEFHDSAATLRTDMDSLATTLHVLASQAKRNNDDETATFLSTYSSQLVDWSQAPLESPSDTNAAVRHLQEVQYDLEHLANEKAQRGEEAGFYERAAGAFEPKLEGKADLVIPE